MTPLTDPKWPKIAATYKFDWHKMSDRDKVHFICVVEYNKERQRRVDSDPEIIKFTARVAESTNVSDMVMGRLQDMKDAACADMTSVADRELAMIKALNLPQDPPRLVQNPNNGSYDVMFCDMSYLHLTAKEAQSFDGRKQIKAKLAELELKR